MNLKEELEKTLSYFEHMDLVDTYAKQCGAIEHVPSEYHENYVQSYIKHHGYDASVLPIILKHQSLMHTFFHHVPIEVWTSPEVYSQLSHNFKAFAFKHTQSCVFQPQATEALEAQFDVLSNKIKKCNIWDNLLSKHELHTSVSNMIQDMKEVLLSPTWPLLLSKKTDSGIWNFIYQFVITLQKTNVPHAMTELLAPFFAEPSIVRVLQKYKVELPWSILAYIPVTSHVPYQLSYSLSALASSLEKHPQLYDVLPHYVPQLNKIRGSDPLFEFKVNIFKLQDMSTQHVAFGKWWNKLATKIEMYPPYLYFSVLTDEQFEHMTDGRDLYRFSSLCQKLSKNWGPAYEEYQFAVQHHYAPYIALRLPVESFKSVPLTSWFQSVFSYKKEYDMTQNSAIIPEENLVL